MSLENAARTAVRKLLRPDPLLDFRFFVEIDGLLVAGFSKVTGLIVNIETEPYNEGGVNDYVHVLPKTVKFENIVLTHGILYSIEMWRWIRDVMRGKIEKRDGRILLLDTTMLPVWCWEFSKAYPVKWTGSDLDAQGTGVFAETLELSHQGIEKIPMGMGAAPGLV